MNQFILTFGRVKVLVSGVFNYKYIFSKNIRVNFLIILTGITFLSQDLVQIIFPII